jgi:hypothetical protein
MLYYVMLCYEGVVNLPVGSMDPLFVNIIDSNFSQVESRGDFAAVIQSGLAKV